MGKGGQRREWNHTTTWNKDVNGDFAEEPSTILSGRTLVAAAIPDGATPDLSAAAGGTLYLTQILVGKMGAGATGVVTDSEGNEVLRIGGGSVSAATNEPIQYNFSPPINCGDKFTFTGGTETWTQVTFNFIQQINTNNE